MLSNTLIKVSNHVLNKLHLTGKTEENMLIRSSLVHVPLIAILLFCLPETSKNQLFSKLLHTTDATFTRIKYSQKLLGKLNP